MRLAQMFLLGTKGADRIAAGGSRRDARRQFEQTLGASVGRAGARTDRRKCRRVNRYDPISDAETACSVTNITPARLLPPERAAASNGLFSGK